jgi:hypothetical protein
VPQDVKVLGYIGIMHLAIRRRDELVENGKCIPHGPISALGDDIEGLVVGLNLFLLCHIFKVCGDIGGGDAAEVVDLSTRQNRGQDFVFFRGCQYEDGVGGWLLQGFEEGIKGILGEHVHLVDYVYLITSILGRDSNLVDDGSDLVNAVVRRSVKFENIEATLGLFLRKTVDCVSENACASGLSDPSRTTKKVGLGNFSRFDAVPKGVGDRFLTDDRFPCGWTVLPCGYEKVAG